MRLNLPDIQPEVDPYVEGIFSGREIPVIGNVFAEKVARDYSGVPENPVIWELDLALWAEEEPHTNKGERTIKIFSVGVIANVINNYITDTVKEVERINVGLHHDRAQAGKLIARRILYAVEARTIMEDLRTGVRDLLTLGDTDSLEGSLVSFLQAEADKTNPPD